MCLKKRTYKTSSGGPAGSGKGSPLYKSDISAARWMAYDIPGNIGWIIYLVGLILLFISSPEYMADKVTAALTAAAVIPALLMLTGVIELISERIHKLDWTLPRIRLIRGFGALTLGGILGTVIAAVMMIYAAITGAVNALYVWLMFAGGILCGVFALLICKKYKPVEK